MIILLRLNCSLYKSSCTESMNSAQSLHDEVRKLLQELIEAVVERNILRNCDPFSLVVQNTNFHVPLTEVSVGIHASEDIRRKHEKLQTELQSLSD